MKTSTLPRIFVLFIIAFSFNLASAQQWVVNDKDQTRPDPNRNLASSSFSTLSAQPFNGYNEISWTAASDAQASKYVIEYSIDGISYQSAGEMVPSLNSSSYELKHYTRSTEPLLYRIRTENATGRAVYSKNFAVDGIPVAPLRLYPNTVTTNTLNVNSNWPVLRVNIFSLDGGQVFAKDLNGQREYIPIAIPSLGKGMYLVNFIGDGWTFTEKILVP